MTRSKPLAPPRDAKGRARPSTLKEWGVPRGHDTQWQLSAREQDDLQVLVPAQLHIFNTAELWKLCPLKGCQRARQCTGTPKDGAVILNRPPCMRPPHLYGDRGAPKAGRKTKAQFMACWEAFREVMQVLRPHI